MTPLQGVYVYIPNTKPEPISAGNPSCTQTTAPASGSPVIGALPSCPATPRCKADSCPSADWTMSKEFATSSYDFPDGPAVIYYHACYPPEPLPIGCDLFSATRQATVTTGEDQTVILTLCKGATYSGGVRAACQQNCVSRDDCDNNLVCTNGKCTVPPRLVRITDSGIQSIVSGDNDCSTQPNAFASLDLTCDPQATSAIDDWLCPFPGSSTTPAPGGTADAVFKLNANGDCNQLQFHVCCQMDPLGKGGIVVATDMRLLDGCGASAEDEGDAVQWTANLRPATWQDPYPAPVACTYIGTAECTPVNTSCWKNGPLAADPCCVNSADIGTVVMYANVPRP